ncbi:hypothetical protein [Mycobacteroides abscessus]|uniref:hypothetical protein n=1 Tax=Mycobacteroides abscessus TaxID=36809 RepID=UPI00036E575E|nr:hypothetical protein [Mycobacteroides abscessus]
MKFDEASHLWAEKELAHRGIQTSSIDYVWFEANSRYECDTCGRETYIEVSIGFTDWEGQHGFYRLEFQGLEGVMGGLFEVSENGAT